jgi:hypothetical protein
LIRIEVGPEPVIGILKLGNRLGNGRVEGANALIGESRDIIGRSSALLIKRSSISLEGITALLELICVLEEGLPALIGGRAASRSRPYFL